MSCGSHGTLDRYVNLQVAHAPGISATFSPPPWVSDPDMHQGTCVTHVLCCMPGSLTSGFLWNRWRGKRSRHSRRLRNPRFYVSGKRSIDLVLFVFAKPMYRREYASEILTTKTSPELYASCLLIYNILVYTGYTGKHYSLMGNSQHGLFLSLSVWLFSK